MSDTAQPSAIIDLPPGSRIKSATITPEKIRRMRASETLESIIKRTEKEQIAANPEWEPLKVTHFSREMLRFQTEERYENYQERGILMLKIAMAAHNLKIADNVGSLEIPLTGGQSKIFAYWTVRGILTCNFNVSREISSHDTDIAVNKAAVPESLWQVYLKKYYDHHSNEADALAGIMPSNFYMLGNYNPDDGVEGHATCVSMTTGEDLIFEFPPKTYDAKDVLKDLEELAGIRK